MRRRHLGCTGLALLVVLLPPFVVAAQTLSTPDLADPWQVSYVATPTGAFTGGSIRAYKGTVTFSATGAASGTLVADEFTPGALTFTVAGGVALSAEGRVSGTLTLTGLDTRTLAVAEASILVNRHTIVGAATLTRPDAVDTGLITLVRLVSGQTFSRQADLADTWNYHELTPSNQQLNGGDADWTRGKIIFHASGCSAAELFFANGTVREALGDPTAATFG
jgi:hypothetical protein